MCVCVFGCTIGDISVFVNLVPRPFSLDEAIRELDESELEEIHTIINNPELYLCKFQVFYFFLFLLL